MEAIKYSKLEKFLRHRDFILCVAIASVIYLTPNTYFVYYSFMDKFIFPWREAASAGVALIVASGILIYTLRGNMRVANYYMWFEISISSYYYITTIGWDWGLIPAFSFVFMLPISLKHYTTELNKEGLIDDSYWEKENGKLKREAAEAYMQIAELNDVVGHMKKQILIHTDQYNDLSDKLTRSEEGNAEAVSYAVAYREGELEDEMNDLKTQLAEYMTIVDEQNKQIKALIASGASPEDKIEIVEQKEFSLKDASDADLLNMAQNPTEEKNADDPKKGTTPLSPSIFG
jgi:uncharacterized coiled-coil protein SlyX